MEKCITASASTTTASGSFFMELPVIAFASEYKAPDNVPCVKKIDKRVLINAKKANSKIQKGKEKVFCNRKNYPKMSIRLPIYNPLKFLMDTIRKYREQFVDMQVFILH